MFVCAVVDSPSIWSLIGVLVFCVVFWFLGW
jgi:hypothetical protein